MDGQTKTNNSPHWKSEAIILKGPREKNGIEFNISGAIIEHARQLKYLGVVLNDKMRFEPHIEYVVNQAENRMTALAKLMPNMGGPESMKGTALYRVVQSMLLYDAPIWINVLNIKKYKNMITSCRRKALLRAGSAYRTVSAAAIQVVTGVAPIAILYQERARPYRRRDGHHEEARAEKRELTMESWQNE
ncbi:hypothetical protein JTB14_009564 [Gonioctena quinquepunctata]|nr:hypothetical protein JTB14_009564 [Gonioctena quinquepunctata]